MHAFCWILGDIECVLSVDDNASLEIKKKFIEKKGFIPQNITIQKWFSFLLQHGVRPYQSAMNDELHDKKIGFMLFNGTSAQFKSEEKNFNEHYFTKDFKIYSDKISKFVMKCNEKTNNRLAKLL